MSGAAKDVGLLPTTIEFLDHFDDALDVVVGCARKIEMTRWPRLFDIVGNPKILFEVRTRPCGGDLLRSSYGPSPVWVPVG